MSHLLRNTAILGCYWLASSAIFGLLYYAAGWWDSISIVV